MKRVTLALMILVALVAFGASVDTAQAQCGYGGCYTPAYYGGCHTPVYRPPVYYPPVYRPSCHVPVYQPPVYRGCGGYRVYHGCH